MLEVNAKRLTEDAIDLHWREGDAGIDVATPVNIVLQPGKTKIVETGWAFEMQEGWHLLALQKSRHAGKIAIDAPLIDNQYRGQVHLAVRNVSGGLIRFKRGEYLMQLVPYRAPVFNVNEIEVFRIEKTVRGSDAFGSTV